MIADADLRILDVNPALCRILGRPAVDIVGARLTDLVEPGELPPPREIDWDATGPIVRATRTRRPDGGIVWVESTTTVIPGTSGRQLYIQVVDVSEARETQAALAHTEVHDPLTGLYNRSLLIDRVDTACRRAAVGSLVAVTIVALDHFKVVNDTFGYECGDELLVAVAARLRTVVRDTDSLARLGGDEFAILATKLPSPLGALGRASQIAEVLRPSFKLEAGARVVTASLGVSVGAGEATASKLLADASVALSRAKTRGGNTIEIFDEHLRAEAVRRLQMEVSLRHAVEHRQLRLEYQPIVDAATGAPTGAEALVRWGAPGGAVVAPDEFIPIAEDNGLIVDIGAFVLEAACEELARLQAAVDASITMSVNVSATELDDPEFVDRVATVMRRTGIQPRTCAIEITERMLVEDQRSARRTLTRLRALGVRVYLDDFGTGFSSLAYLATFPIDAIKLDRTFIDGLEQPIRQTIVAAILTMARALGLEAIAEGVETTNQLELLRTLGCDHVQGFIVARPLTSQDLLTFLRDTPRPPPHPTAPHEPCS